MKSFLLFLAVVVVFTLTNSATPTVTNAADSSKKEMAVMKFNYTVTLMDVSLKGEYLFVHDDEAMARGEACTYIYKGVYEEPKNLVASFHCIPAARKKAESFTVRTSMVSPGVHELKEYQFAGSTESHLVPITQHAEHVNVAP